jgi:hypothetical protein
MRKGSFGYAQYRVGLVHKYVLLIIYKVAEK